jgi:hypothetical protein
MMMIGILQSSMFLAHAFTITQPNSIDAQRQQQSTLLFPRWATMATSSYIDQNDEFDFDDDDEDETEEEEEASNIPSGTVVKKKQIENRWNNLNPKIKARMIQAGQERAFANKQRRETVQDKKRRKNLVLYHSSE